MKFFLNVARKSGLTSSLLENKSVSRGQNAGKHSDSTRPTGVGCNPSLNGRFCHQRAGSFLIKIGKGRIRDLTGGKILPQKAGSSLIKIGKGRIRALTGDILFPVAFKGTIPTTHHCDHDEPGALLVRYVQ